MTPFWLVIRRAGQPERRVLLRPGRARVGSSGRCGELHVADPSIDEEHLEINLQGEGVEVRPLSATRATLLNGDPIEPGRARRLDVGDRLTLGRGDVELELEGERPAPHVTESAARPLPRVPDGPSRYLRYLPDPFQVTPDGADAEVGFLSNFLRIFEAIWEPIEQRQSNLPLYFQADSAPDVLVPTLLRWTGIDLGDDWPLDRQRALLSQSARLVARPGTLGNLRRTLRLATGGNISVAESATEACTLDVRVLLPSGSPLGPGQIRKLVDQIKPAHVAYHLDIREV